MFKSVNVSHIHAALADRSLFCACVPLRFDRLLRELWVDIVAWHICSWRRVKGGYVFVAKGSCTPEHAVKCFINE